MRSSLLLALVLCIATCAMATKSQVPAIPTKVEGATYFNLAAMKKNTIILNTFLAQTSNFIISAINKKAFAPSSYGVIARGAWRENIYTGDALTGYKITYYTMSHQPGNNKAKDYYANYVATVNVNGSNRKFVGFTLEAALPHGTK